VGGARGRIGMSPQPMKFCYNQIISQGRKQGGLTPKRATLAVHNFDKPSELRQIDEDQEQTKKVLDCLHQLISPMGPLRGGPQMFFPPPSGQERKPSFSLNHGNEEEAKSKINKP
jgi:hypothetical protein